MLMLDPAFLDVHIVKAVKVVTLRRHIRRYHRHAYSATDSAHLTTSSHGTASEWQNLFILKVRKAVDISANWHSLTELFVTRRAFPALREMAVEG
jgi:hypothetical protein